MKDERIIPLENGDYIRIHFNDEGIVYDRFDKNHEIVEEYGYDFYTEITPLTKTLI